MVGLQPVVCMPQRVVVNVVVVVPFTVAVRTGVQVEYVVTEQLLVVVVELVDPCPLHVDFGVHTKDVPVLVHSNRRPRPSVA